MKKLIISIICTLLFAVSLASTSMAEESIILRTTVVTQGDIWRGQRVIINIDVLGSDGWAKIKTMREPEIPGMYILKTETQGTRLNETIGGTSYTGQRYEFSIFPQRSGKLVIPAIPIDVEVKNWGSDAKENLSRKQIEPLAIMVKEPPGAGKIKDLVSTTSLTIKQQWDPEPTTLKVGDAFKRTITTSASDLSGMVFPPLHWGKPILLDIYPGTPEVNDKIEDNQIIGSRIETATYICQHEGTVILPAISITWWNVNAKKWVEENLPALTLNIKANSKITANRNTFADTHGNSQTAWIIATVMLVAMIVSVWLSFHYKIVIQKQLNTLIERYQASERAYYKRFTASCRAGDNRAIYNNLQAWINCADKTGCGRMDVSTGEHGDKQLNQEIHLLWRAVELDNEFNNTALLKSVKQARSKRKKHIHTIRKLGNILPPLNPTQQK